MAARLHASARQWSHSAGLGTEIIYCEEKLEIPPNLLNSASLLKVDLVFDRQARPRVILTSRALTGPAVGVPHKPSYWDLPADVQTLLVELQLRVAKDVEALRVEVHLGPWVSSKYIHAHIVMPLLPYYKLRARAQHQASWSPNDEQMRASYVRKTKADHARYHEEDAHSAYEAANSGHPQLTADVNAFEAVTFDADDSGTAAIDVTFKISAPIRDMPRDELRNALKSIQELCSALAVDGAHLLLPAPALGSLGATGAHQERTARLVLRPSLFVRCLPPEKRLEWYGRWQEGNPVARAYKEDMSLLQGTTSAGQPPPSPLPGGSAPAAPNARIKRNVCSFFSTAQGCRYGDKCHFLHVTP